MLLQKGYILTLFLIKTNRQIRPVWFYWLIVSMFLLVGQRSYSQTDYSSKNNYTGNWETSSTWNPEWAIPLTTIPDLNISIYGNITCYGPLTYTGTSGSMIVYDTLVVNGDLSLGNNNSLAIGVNGLLVVDGNLITGNNTTILTNNYIVVTGNYVKGGAINNGSFASTKIPAKIFIAGTVPTGLDQALFPVFVCPGTSPYTNSGCTYGNQSDLLNDPISSYFRSLVYPTTADTGEDQVGVTMCGVTSTTLEGNTPEIGTGLWTIVSGEGGSFSDATNPASSFSGTTGTTYILRWTISKSPYEDTWDEVTIAFLKAPEEADAGADQDLNYAFTTEMDAQLSPSETGEWSLLSGSGILNDINSPTSTVTGLSTGENIFLWTVWIEGCSDEDSVTITVISLIVPQVITPNDDGKNDKFVIDDLEINGPAELAIFDRWGNKVYQNLNYINDWDGRKSKGTELSNDTYFYVLKLASGEITKGFVVIKR